MAVWKTLFSFCLLSLFLQLPFPCSIMHGPALGSLEEALPCAVTKPLALGFAQKQFM